VYANDGIELSGDTTTPEDGYYGVKNGTRGFYAINKLLWTNSWNSGNITVPGFEDYFFFRIAMDGQGATILASKHGNYLRGIGGYSSATPTIVDFYFAATFVGNVLTFVACLSRNPVTGAITNMTVTAIYGVL
jgi:hypothetical protein